jgi:carboxyl-terminal processing protease
MALPSIIETLPNGDRLQFAVADLTGPSGRRIEGAGVVPDDEVIPTREQLLAGRDPALEAALDWIARQDASATR